MERLEKRRSNLERGTKSIRDHNPLRRDPARAPGVALGVRNRPGHKLQATEGSRASRGTNENDSNTLRRLASEIQIMFMKCDGDTKDEIACAAADALVALARGI